MSSLTSADGGAICTLVSTRTVPFVFQRRESTAVWFEPDTFDRFRAETEMSSTKRWTGRAVARSSNCNAQFVASICRTVADHRFVLLIRAANAFVAARMRTRIPPGAFVAFSAG